MAVKTKRYRALHTTPLAIRNDEVRAIRVTDRNFVSVAEWAGGEARYREIEKDGKLTGVNRRVAVRTPKGIRIAKVGDFVVKSEQQFDGKKKVNFYVGKDDVFEAQFDLVAA